MGNIAPFVRIGLRIVGGFLIGKGWASEQDVTILMDPEIIGVICLVISEGWFLAAKKFGWAT